MNNRSEPMAKRAAGWREWAALPELGIDRIKVKLDTGAKSSALHAFDITEFERDGVAWAGFSVHPVQRNDEIQISCEAQIADRRWVTNPGGRRQRRIIISTNVRLGGETWPIELGLTDRDEMGFRMLLGRSAMKGALLVDPSRSFLLSPQKRRSGEKIQGAELKV